MFPLHTPVWGSLVPWSLMFSADSHQSWAPPVCHSLFLIWWVSPLCFHHISAADVVSSQRVFRWGRFWPDSSGRWTGPPESPGPPPARRWCRCWTSSGSAGRWCAARRLRSASAAARCVYGPPPGPFFCVSAGELGRRLWKCPSAWKSLPGRDPAAGGSPLWVAFLSSPEPCCLGIKAGSPASGKPLTEPLKQRAEELQELAANSQQTKQADSQTPCGRKINKNYTGFDKRLGVVSAVIPIRIYADPATKY